MFHISVVQLRAGGPHAARGTILHNSSLVDHKQRQPCITRHGELMEQNLGLRPIPSEDFFFRERYDFGTKIGIFGWLRPASSNNFEKWPTRVRKLDHPVPYNNLTLQMNPKFKNRHRLQ